MDDDCCDQRNIDVVDGEEGVLSCSLATFLRSSDSSRLWKSIGVTPRSLKV